MLDILLNRLKQGNKTLKYPAGEPPTLPEHFRGLPLIKVTACPAGCQECVKACPTQAITALADSATLSSPSAALAPQALQLDLGKCLFCTDCQDSCPAAMITFSKEYRLASTKRSALTLTYREQLPEPPTLLPELQELGQALKKILGRSLQLRQVSAGGCNACEADIKVLNTVVFDLSRFGIQFVASPRHADGLLVTGPISKNMLTALKKTYDALPPPRIVIAVGACTISGGIYQAHEEVVGALEQIMPVDLYIPGCPPHPLTILAGLLALLGRYPPA